MYLSTIGVLKERGVLTSGDLEVLTGESRRTIQFWTDGGVLRPDPDSLGRGPGRPRLYPDIPDYGEGKWALLAGRFSMLGLTLSELRDAIDQLRRAFEPPLG